jgi:hypothetical protein
MVSSKVSAGTEIVLVTFVRLVADAQMLGLRDVGWDISPVYMGLPAFLLPLAVLRFVLIF